jgi:putative flippase GtrA
MMAMLRDLWRYIQISCVSFLLNFGLTLVLHERGGVSEEIAFATAVTVVFITNFFALRYYIYGENLEGFWRQLLVYSSSALAFRAAEYAGFLVCHTWLGGDYRLVVIGLTVLSSGVKFFYYRVFFDRHRRHREQGEGERRRKAFPASSHRQA